MAGGRIAYAGPGKVILGSGDYHWDGLYAPRSLPQGTDNDYGKVIEINVATGESQHLSIGNRNVQGVMVDRGGHVWAVEHGPRGGDELNLVQKGRNFGWPDATLGTRYNKLPWPTTAPHGRHDGFDAPVHAWLPSIGVSNLVQVERFDSTWDGDFLVGSLKAGTLFRLRETDGRIVFAEPMEIGERIRYVHQHQDGRIVLWTDDAELVFVTKSAASQSFAYIEEAIEKLELEPRRKAGISMAILACAECHSFEPNEHRDAPSLANIHGRRTAATSFRGYSPALRSLGGAWTDERIASYLTYPTAMRPARRCRTRASPRRPSPTSRHCCAWSARPSDQPARPLGTSNAARRSRSISSRIRAASSNSRLRACLYISASSFLIRFMACSGPSSRPASSTMALRRLSPSPRAPSMMSCTAFTIDCGVMPCCWLYRSACAPAAGLVEGPLHRTGDPIGIEDHAAVDIARGAAGGLDQRPFGAQEALLVSVEDGHQRHFGHVEAFTQQVDANQHIESPSRRSRMISPRSTVSISACRYRTLTPCSSKYSVRSSAMRFVSVVIRTRSCAPRHRWISESRSST